MISRGRSHANQSSQHKQYQGTVIDYLPNMSSVLEGPQIALRASTPSGPLGMTGPTKQPRGNQATYLFFPVLISLVLTIIGTLSASIIPGVSTVEVYSKYGEGVVKLGAWGICIEQFPHYA